MGLDTTSVDVCYVWSLKKLVSGYLLELTINNEVTKPVTVVFVELITH